MKNSLLLLALAIVLGAANSGILAENVEGAPRSVPESASLTRLFAVMTEIASDGPSLSYFGWTEEKSSTPANADCRPAGSHDAEMYLRNTVRDMDWASAEQGDAIKRDLAVAVTDLHEILGREPIDQCDWDVTEQMTLTKITKFTNTVTGYQLVLSLGYED